MPYLKMGCGKCKATFERYHNIRFCPECGKRLTPATEIKPKTWNGAVARFVRRERINKRLTLKALAKRSGLSVTFLSDVENGNRGISLRNWWILTRRGLGVTCINATAAVIDSLPARLVNGWDGKD